MPMCNLYWVCVTLHKTSEIHSNETHTVSLIRAQNCRSIIGISKNVSLIECVWIWNHILLKSWWHNRLKVSIQSELRLMPNKMTKSGNELIHTPPGYCITTATSWWRHQMCSLWRHCNDDAVASLSSNDSAAFIQNDTGRFKKGCI